MNYADKLVAMANYLYARPELLAKLDGIWDNPGVSIWADDKETFATVCKAMGTFEKSAYSGTVTARYEADERAFVVSANLSGACVKSPKLDDNGNPVTRTIPATEERVVEEYEYHCPESFLNL